MSVILSCRVVPIFILPSYVRYFVVQVPDDYGGRIGSKKKSSGARIYGDYTTPLLALRDGIQARVH
jgi:hypothetical protein